jgi:drug/metabolite transporter (DMT)-like permease
MFSLPDVEFVIWGELAALSAACLWALGSVIYTHAGARIPALELNLIKTVVAIAFIALTFLLQGVSPPDTSPLPLYLLLLSGVVGIGLADTFFLEALKQLGARRTLLIKTLDPPTAALLSTIFLQEKLSAIAWCGILLVILGVAWVITERVAGTSTDGKFATSTVPIWGIICGLLSAVGQAIGAVLSRQAFVQTNISPLWSVLLRLAGALLVIGLWMLAKPHPVGLWLKPFVTNKDKSIGRILGAVIFAAFASTFLGIWLQQTALKFTAAGIAQTLSATSPLFVLPIVIWMGEVVSLRAFVGVLISLVGVGLLLSLG